MLARLHAQHPAWTTGVFLEDVVEHRIVTDAAGSTRLLAALRHTAEALDELHQAWALVGGRLQPI